MTALRIVQRCSGGEDVPEGEVKLLVAKLEEPDRFATIYYGDCSAASRARSGMNGGRCRGGNWGSGRLMRRKSYRTDPPLVPLGGKARRSDMVSHVKILLETLADEEEHYKKILKRKLLKTPKYPDEDDDDPERVKRRS